MTSEPEPLVIFHQKSKMYQSVRVLLGYILLMLLAFMVSWMRSDTVSIIMRFFGAAILLYLMANIVWVIRRARSPIPALVIDKRGIYDDSSAIGAGLVTWDQIESVFIGKLSGPDYLCIVPRDVEAFLQRQPMLKRRVMQSNMKLVKAPIVISTAGLPLSLNELLRLIQSDSDSLLRPAIGSSDTDPLTLVRAVDRER